MVILAVWDVPEAAKWFAFNSSYTQVAMSSVLYGWANDILRRNATERSVIPVFMNLVAQSTTAWTSVLVFPTVEAPRFLKGFAFCATNSFVLVLFTYVVVRPFARSLERKLDSEESGGDAGVVTESEESASEKDVARDSKDTTVAREVAVWCSVVWYKRTWILGKLRARCDRKSIWPQMVLIKLLSSILDGKVQTVVTGQCGTRAGDH